MASLQEVQEFCIKNAGKVASGVNRNGSPISGRILAFNGYGDVLLETDPNKKNDKVPNPLPKVPYKLGDWYRVIADCGIGMSVKFDTITLEEKATTAQPKPTSTPSFDQPTTYVQAKPSNRCGHDECDSWCHRKYVGLN